MFLETGNKTECFGCEACKQICPKQAIEMYEDNEGFRYPFIEESKCVHCNLCRKTCPHTVMPQKHIDNKYAFGGYSKDSETRFESTSGGAFSAIAEAYCNSNYVVFGVESKGLLAFHSYITELKELGKYRKSKYSQSIIGENYKSAKDFLEDGKRVIFSGTPCQIAGLYAYLNAVSYYDTQNLLTVEVVCEGVPSPIYLRKLDGVLETKFGSKVDSLDYRYTGKSLSGNGKWDFETMRIQLMNKKVLKKDRWFNPFWQIWLNHLMSRPSCYRCPFAEQGRTADITLGDLWGVHLFCPELYGKNGGSSLAVGNTIKGTKVLMKAEKYMHGHELVFEDALKYQSPLRKPIETNPLRDAFMSDLTSNMSWGDINRKWTKKPSLKLLFQKYVWGNRQKLFYWNFKQKIMGKKRDR